MKRDMVRLLLSLTATSILAIGCYTRHYEPVVATGSSGEVVVSEVPPPAPRSEVIGVAPSTAHLWIPVIGGIGTTAGFGFPAILNCARALRPSGCQVIGTTRRAAGSGHRDIGSDPVRQRSQRSLPPRLRAKRGLCFAA